MQTLNNIPSDFTLTRLITPIYEAYSVKDLPRCVNVPMRFRRMLDIVHRAAGKPLPEGGNSVWSLPYKPDMSQRPKAFIAFSGGKDCLAAAIRAEQEGYDPTLFHIRGINMSLTSEYKHAKAIAEKIGYPYIEMKINFKGTKEYNEHPLRNILILSLMIDEGLKQGVTAYSLGNIFEYDTSHANIDYDLSDGIDILRSFSFFMQSLIPEFKLLCYIHDNLQSFYTVWKRDKALIPMLTTCCTPDFRKPMIRKHSLEKYGAAVLSETGCGGCYKCAREYLYKVKFGMISSSPAYTKRAMELIAKFDNIHIKNFSDGDRTLNRYGGRNTDEPQVLCDRIGYYIGRLQLDKRLFMWFSKNFYGHRHYETREEAETILKRFLTLYRL
ncbi:MAG: hypothetical protein II401_10960 [Bacteroidales bacterium]|nr:hypothetical protein [Bacteroidales bacterium]